jgi:hypothetical protein
VKTLVYLHSLHQQDIKYFNREMEFPHEYLQETYFYFPNEWA